MYTPSLKENCATFQYVGHCTKYQMWWMDFNLHILNIPTPFLHAKRDLNTIDEISIYSSNVGNEIWQTYKLYHNDASKKASLHCKFASTHHFRHTSFLRQWNISINFCLVYLTCWLFYKNDFILWLAICWLVVVVCRVIWILLSDWLLFRSVEEHCASSGKDAQERWFKSEDDQRRVHWRGKRE